MHTFWEGGAILELVFWLERIYYSAVHYGVMLVSTNDNIPNNAIGQNNTVLKRGKFLTTVLYENSVDVSEDFKYHQHYRAYGEFKPGKYGLNFAADYIEPQVTETKEDIVNLLRSISGIGKTMAERIYKKHQLDTIRIFDEGDKDTLSKVRGISVKRAEKMLRDYDSKRANKDSMIYLSQLGISSNKRLKIISVLGDKVRETIEEDPYLLCDLADLNFQDADSITKQLGGDLLYSMSRLKHAIRYILSGLCFRGGHLFIDEETVCKKTEELLKGAFSLEKIRHAMAEEIAEGNLFREGSSELIYPKRFKIAEKETAKKLVDMLFYRNHADADTRAVQDKIGEAEREMGITLSSKQKDAVLMALTNNVSVITGGPGTGKTTILRVILYVYSKLCGGGIFLSAPTGRAARRMAESTGYEANTVHSLLGLTPDCDKDGWMPAEIEANFLVVDESSMLDQQLLYYLLSAVPYTCRLLLLGDAEQLPSVNPGNCLREIIQSGVIPTTVLDVIFRQAETSGIVKNAAKILTGDTDFTFNKRDFIFLEEQDEEKAEDRIVSTFVGVLRKMKYSTDDVQILCPYKLDKIPCSTIRINRKVQDLVNPPLPSKPELPFNGMVYRVGDKVIQQKNTDLAKNGDIGRIIGIKTNETGNTVIEVRFDTIDTPVQYTKDDILDLGITLAYAITGHKSQGSEYKIILMPVVNSHRNMLSKNLIYTIWTRAKERVIMVGDLDVLKKYAPVSNIDTRHTLLAKRLRARYTRYNNRKTEKKRA